MPELPEVETIRRGLEPICAGKAIAECKIYTEYLKYKIPQQLPEIVKGQEILELKRRGKYLIIVIERGGIIFHFGMTGRIDLKENKRRVKHEHLIMSLDSGEILSYYDPRRFGAILWEYYPILNNFCLELLGLEALSEEFNGEYLYERLRRKEGKIKNWIMDNNTVVGVGNIYASESLYKGKILPMRVARSLSLEECERLSKSIKEVLNKAIEKGGTTIKDFRDHKGQLGYFTQELMVYGRAGQGCEICGNEIKKVKILDRGTYYCGQCQK